ncbi:MAG: selenide, water dikinase SelD, partial [Acidimicrobiia bacterium]|nr:selenide, water dikinase SelD [Acidimicrobiia bacterium]
GWNTSALSSDLLAEVLLGAQDVAAEGGFAIAGGHTVDDPEPKFGLAVVGEAQPDRLLTNAGFRAGQSLVLTKPLGIGVITTAGKNGLVDPSAMDAAVAAMTTLNADAARLALEAGATGGTDVTGFGLVGHLGRAAIESEVDVTLEVDRLPVLPTTRELISEGVVPGGTHRNLAHVEAQLDRGSHGQDAALLVADAQTSGGLVFGVEPSGADSVVSELVGLGHTAAVVGNLTNGSGRIHLR